MTPTKPQENKHVDPRQTLAKWANDSDEWVRRIVRLILSSGKPLGTDDLDEAYALFRQEKSFDKRAIEAEPKLEIAESTDVAEEPLTITRLSEVNGVNAILPGSVIEPHAGLTILYGENGTGKTGYSRIFKALADSRTADVILGDVDGDGGGTMSAKLEYSIGAVPGEFVWTGERGKAPFTRMSIFDSRAVNIHVDGDCPQFG